jgi:SAM-dependent methyltransferase
LSESPVRSVTDVHLAAVLRTEMRRRGLVGARLLDAGCGGGDLLAHLLRGPSDPDRPLLDPFGFDVVDSGTGPTSFPKSVIDRLEGGEDEAAGLKWDDRIRAIAEGDPWPFDSASFDAVVSNQVMEHVLDLDQFIGENERVLVPGGFAVHLFPLKHYMIEGHTHLPLIHRLRGWDQREGLIRILSRVGLGEQKNLPGSLEDYSVTRADFIDFDTNYVSWADLHRRAKSHGLRISYRYTDEFYLAKLRDMAGRPPRLELALERSALRDAITFRILRYVQGVTIVLERPVSPHRWRGGG